MTTLENMAGCLQKTRHCKGEALFQTYQPSPDAGKAIGFCSE